MTLLIRPILCLIILLATLANTSAATKLAIVATSPDAEQGAQILTATLSKNSALALLERAALDKILREQSLALSQTTNILRAGQLLGADALLIIGTSGNRPNQNLELRLVSVKEGAVLYATRASWPLADLPRWAERISPTIGATASKSAGSKVVVPISVLNLRSPASSAASELLDRELTSLLLLRMSAETNLLVLERRRLSDLVLEKDLAASSERFWSGAFLLDGIVNKEGIKPGIVTLSARLIAPDKTETVIDVSASTDKPNALIEALIRPLLRAVSTRSTAGAWDPAREAKEHADEAEWALRWNMFPEAQAAADAAWALGVRTRDLARVRGLAHLRDQGSSWGGYTMQGTLHLTYPSEPPNHEKTAAILRALATLDDFIASDTDALGDDPFYRAVSEALGDAGEILQRYYLMMEARVGHEEMLAEIRRLSRDLQEKTLKHPVVRRRFWEPMSTNVPIALRLVTGTNVFESAAKFGGLYYEKPEDVLPFLRDFIAAARFPEMRHHFLLRQMMAPVLCGWTWQDRARYPAVWRGFIDELISSTNYLTHFEGQVLDVSYEPNWASYQVKVRALFDDMLVHRDALTKPVRGIRTMGLTSLSFRAHNLEVEESQTFANFVEDFIVDNGFVGNYSSNRKRVTTNKQPPPSAAPARSIKVTDYWAAPPSPPTTQGYVPERALSGAIIRDGQLWFRLSGESSPPIGRIPYEIFAIDLKTKKSRHIEMSLPEFSSFVPAAALMNPTLRLPKSFEVWSNAVYVVEKTNLLRFDLKNEKWTKFVAPSPGADLYLVNDRLFLSGKDSIFELDEAGASTVIASARRKPAAGILDELNSFEYPTLQAGPSGMLLAIIANQTYGWDGKLWKPQKAPSPLYTLVPADRRLEIKTPGGNLGLELSGISFATAYSRGFGVRQPWLLETPDAIFFGHLFISGFWTLPKKDIPAAP